ncbi:Fasciclin domain-containing protein [Aspergillus crustosus]
MKLQLLAVAAPLCSALAIQDVLGDLKDIKDELFGFQSPLDDALESSPTFTPANLGTDNDNNNNFNFHLINTDHINTWIKTIFSLPFNEILNPPSDLANDLDPNLHLHPIHSDKTIYQLISESKYTTILAKIIDSDSELVAYLNATDHKLTFFAPTDDAFRKIPHHHHHQDGDHDHEHDGGNGDGDGDHRHRIPKELIRAILRYHSSPEVLKAIQLFHAHTIPTALEDALLGIPKPSDDKDEGEETGLPQRLTVRSGFKGLTLNFYSHIVAADIGASNGLIHGISSILLPPPPSLLLLDILPTKFSTFNLALHKTSLASYLNTTTEDRAHGFTIFTPSNKAFEHLGLKINAFLFSPFGEKYLRALVKYHIVPNTTVYSDTVYTSEGVVKPFTASTSTVSDSEDPETEGLAHFDLETLLEGHKISVDVAHFGPYVSFKVNGWQRVAFADVLARDGVIQVLDHVLIPPKHLEQQQQEEADDGELTVEDLVERLQPWVEDQDQDDIYGDGVGFEEALHGWDL